MSMPASTNAHEQGAGVPDAGLAFGGPGMVSAVAYATVLTCARDCIYMLRTWVVWGAGMGV